MINLAALLRLFNQNPTFRALGEHLVMGTPIPQPLEVPAAARPVLLAALHQYAQAPVVMITARADRARLYADQLRFWLEDPDQVYLLPDSGVFPYEQIPWNEETIALRLAALTRLATAEKATTPPILVTSARALLQKVLPPPLLRQSMLTYRLDQQVSMSATLADWVALGYHHSGVVETPGEFSHRGGIMDVFPPSESYPVRIELFGDEIDSIRAFDPITQRSAARLKSFTVGPATEALPRLAPHAAAAMTALQTDNLQPMAEHALQETIVALENGTAFRGIENYLAFMHPQLTSVLDYLPADGLVLVENPMELTATVQDLTDQLETLHSELVRQHTLSEDWAGPHLDWAPLLATLHQRRAVILGFDPWPEPPADIPPVDMPSLQTIFGLGRVFGGQLKTAITDIITRKKNGERVVVASRQAARISHLLDDEEIVAPVMERLDIPPATGSITLFNGPILEGWHLRVSDTAAPMLTFYTDAELFGVKKPQARRKSRRRRGVNPETFFADVNPGDYVVHIEHGIGAFKGMTKLDFDGVTREYLEVNYSQGDKLYVPIHQADRLSRYVGLEESVPTLNRLGTADWTRTKKRAKAAVADIADQLLSLYVARSVEKGRRFPPDTDWQRELETSFAYVETEDQYNAINDVKRDMEDEKPMDRLICGDVGYGKTEVALRAAFKAVMAGTQVAVLVPTTVLAQQHFETFRARLAAFPVTVEMLSRFRTRRQADEVVRGLITGGVDIVIGTHRLLSKDVAFKNLGLLVIDEEQRFGVRHKERLRELKINVDTITLSATPIPRTLHMAMTGVRDMSVIDTPPEERLPIKTTVTHDDDTLVRTAITRELDRGGQVFFVHNRVMGIEQMANRIRKLVPYARVVVGHGQMRERELEKVMVAFSKGEFDVLVSTTIIESGLDIPNVNTIIINRADRFGLAQLYQLRGRVGRAAIQSYAYLLVPKNYTLSELAQKRLDAIREASELGAGFKIAMRDLEIRGAGDILGAKQHGHIASVGFDLYVRLLAQAVHALQGETEPGDKSNLVSDYLSPLEEDIQINLPMAVYLPEDYVSETNLRLKLYRRMGNLYSLEEVAGMGQELEDRFGPMPEPVLNLLYQLKIKALCRSAGVKMVSGTDKTINIYADSLEYLDRTNLARRLNPGIRVNRRQILVPLRDDFALWQADLELALQWLSRMVNDPA